MGRLGIAILRAMGVLFWFSVGACSGRTCVVIPCPAPGFDADTCQCRSRSTPNGDASTTPAPEAGPPGSLGTVSIDFTTMSAVGYCTTGGCGDPSPIQILDPSGKNLILSLPCGTLDCTTCTAIPCITTDCQSAGVAVTSAQLKWDGRYYEPGTCSGGTMCATPVYAKQGRYTANVCFYPGTLTKPAGAPVCNQKGQADCGSVPFEYPEHTVASGIIVHN